jgi:hypothetical protein
MFRGDVQRTGVEILADLSPAPAAKYANQTANFGAVSPGSGAVVRERAGSPLVANANISRISFAYIPSRQRSPPPSAASAFRPAPVILMRTTSIALPPAFMFLAAPSQARCGQGQQSCRHRTHGRAREVPQWRLAGHWRVAPAPRVAPGRGDVFEGAMASRTQPYHFPRFTSS